MKENLLEKSPIELLLLARILYRLEKIEIDQSLLLVKSELKTLQEKGFITGYRMRFNDIDEDLSIIKEDIRKLKKNSFSLFQLKQTVEIVMDRYFVKDVGARGKKRWWGWFG